MRNEYTIDFTDTFDHPKTIAAESVAHAVEAYALSDIRENPKVRDCYDGEGLAVWVDVREWRQKEAFVLNVSESNDVTIRPLKPSKGLFCRVRLDRDDCAHDHGWR